MDEGIDAFLPLEHALDQSLAHLGPGHVGVDGQRLSALLFDGPRRGFGIVPALAVAERHGPAPLAQTQPNLTANAFGSTGNEGNLLHRQTIAA